ncbi:MAG: multiheme c-type cytochrome [bacterium]|nr:multiheme c-type cytochrome [bacterium]
MRIILIVIVLAISQFSMASICIDCHKSKTPNIVSDWQLSKHSQNGIGCEACHGEDHKTSTDFAKVKLPTPETCKLCHEEQVAQFSKGKHALAWAAMKAMPSFHSQPDASNGGTKGCAGCHQIGLKSVDEIKELKKTNGGFGVASCDACHTRHTFSVTEAKQPQACQTCHMGFDHPQWEMYSNSKHGVRALLKQSHTIPEGSAAPTCQTCHMQSGNHEVMTGWGFLAVRLPLPEDKQWKDDQVTILQGLGVLDPDGKPTGRLDVVKGAKVARLTQEEFDAQRNKMIKTCNECHSEQFAKNELAHADSMIKAADHVLAEAIREVAGLYKDGLLKKPANYAYAFPDLLNFHDSPTVIEQKLFRMHLEYRMRTFQGAFHMNPDYTNWYGWSELKQTLSEVKEMAVEMRRKH